MDLQGLRHLQALRSFIGNLVDQAERSGGCDCHKPPSLLLVGPPGAGKTYLVKQMSNVCEMPLYGVHTNQVRGAPAVRKLFEQARENYPSLVFMDDVDTIFANHDRDPECSPLVQNIRDELFTQLGPRKLKILDPKSSKNPTDSLVSASRGVNGVGGSRASSPASSTSRPRPSAPPDEDEEEVFSDDESAYPDNNGIIVVAATSAPWMLYKDHELLSRFRGVYLVGLPDKQTRYNLLRNLFQDVHHNLSDKDIMLVAEKTEGFTPADLMVVVKTLTYRQFSFLLSMASARTGSVGSSSDVGSTGSQTPLSSEMSETASESDLDGLPESEGHLKRGAATAAVAAVAATAVAAVAGAMAKPRGGAVEQSNAASGAVPKKDMKQVNGVLRKSLPGTASPSSVVSAAAAVTAAAAAVSTLSALGDEWDSDSDTDHEGEGPYASPESQRGEKMNQPNEVAPTRVMDDTLVTAAPVTVVDGEEGGQEERPRDELCVPSPDSAIGLSKSNEEMEEAHNTSRLEESEALPRAPSESSSSGVTSSGCDSSDNGDVSAIVDDAAKEHGGHSDNEVEREHTEAASEEWGDRTTGEEPSSPRDAATEMGSAAEVVGAEEEAACGSSGEEPVAGSLGTGEEEEERVGTPLDFELHYTEPAEPMRDDNCAIDSDSDNEVSESGRSRGRRVAFSGMSTMEPLTVDVGDVGGAAPNVSLDDLPPNITLAPSSLPEPLLPDDRHQDGAPNAILLSLLARPSPARDRDRDRDRDRERRMEEPTGLASFLHHDTDLDVTKTSTPIEPMDALTPTPSLTRSPTPTPSVASSNNGTVASSGSGRRASVGSTSSEVHKKEDSDSSFDHSDGHTVPSSDMSTATCNETGETMECRTDSDERLQELEDGPDQTDSARASEYGEGGEAKSGIKGGLNSLLNLDDLGEISIQLITLADVLEVVGKGYRSISDEEIKRYTDFMVWFSNVAKSACPHSKDGRHHPNAPNLDEISLDSTVYDTPSIAKKRKGPLRKLGRFLLKALMFILD